MPLEAELPPCRTGGPGPLRPVGARTRRAAPARPGFPTHGEGESVVITVCTELRRLKITP